MHQHASRLVEISGFRIFEYGDESSMSFMAIFAMHCLFVAAFAKLSEQLEWAVILEETRDIPLNYNLTYGMFLSNRAQSD